MDPLFAHAPVPLWVADFSALKRHLAPHLGGGHDAIRAALDGSEELKQTCIAAVQVAQANEAAAALMGADSADAMRGPLSVLLPATAATALTEQIAAVASGRTPLVQEAIEIGTPEAPVIIELHLSMPDAADWSRVIVATIDQTNRAGAEERLRASEDRFRAICEHAPVMIDQFDAEGNLVLWNRECELHLGWTQEEVQAHPDPLSLFYPNAEERQRVVDSIVRRDGQFREYRVLAKDGHPRQQMWADLRLPSGDQISVGHDITEQRAFEEQMRQTQKLESLGLMAGGIAHDFNNLLVGVLANADLARIKRPHDDELRGMLNRVVESAQRAADLSRQLLAYSGGATFTPVPLDLSALVSELAPMVAASSKHVAIEYALAAGLPSVEGDATQLGQVIFNLVLNASEALEGGDGHVEVRTGNDGHRVWLEVTDNGVGMDEETRSRMFDPFYTTKFTGRGLGLASVLGIVRGHGGGVEVESEPGRGTRCLAWFPASDAAVADARSEAWVEETHAGLVLVVDDEPTVRETIQRLLEALGYEVRAQPGGELALAWFREHADAVRAALIDATMPDMSGPKLVEALRAIRPNLPAVLVSGYTPETIKGLDQSTTRFVQKPFTLQTLGAALSGVLAGPGE